MWLLIMPHSQLGSALPTLPTWRCGHIEVSLNQGRCQVLRMVVLVFGVACLKRLSVMFLASEAVSEADAVLVG